MSSFKIDLPEQTTNKFNDVISQVGVKPYVLRFWESEFEQIQPLLSETGQKLYTPKDVAVIKRIKELLFDNKFSIPKAKLVIDSEMGEQEAFDLSYHEEELIEDAVEEMVDELDDEPTAELEAITQDEEEILEPIITEAPAINVDLSEIRETIAELQSLAQSMKSRYQSIHSMA